MKIHDLEYLDVERVGLVGEGTVEICQVSLYGHWVHVRKRGRITSYPASLVAFIEWVPA